ncbi:isoaspartyl peptidase/L-asparaginase [Parasalinivibrio latis]|uniref:isoaspartyl peptidase/L-asparaginase family protein n=1 Tax=Parasalinivibrio latis TaxID=2952610 RepID=UPI0030DFF226
MAPFFMDKKQMGNFAIAIHGGAGTIERHLMTPELEASYRTALATAAKAGYDVLAKGGTALDATVAAVSVMEDSPLFNAGKGSVLTHNEEVEMDALVMDGATLEAGAVAAIKHIKNPVLLARDVMSRSNHVMLFGEGAEQFAFRECGYDYTEQDYFFTDRRYDQLQAMKELDGFALSEASYKKRDVYPDDHKHGTVGAVALDSHGNLAAATSTGGLTNKKYGRVGDSPVIGAGTYARNGNVAVSGTGMGEVFLRCTVASEIAARMRYLGESVAEASERVVQGELKSLGGEGGTIAVDAAGCMHFAMNCSGMYRAEVGADGQCRVAIFADEALTAEP